MPTVLSDRLYAPTHEWILVEGDTLSVGITDFAQDAVGDIVFVNLPDEGAALRAGDELCTLESVKSVSPIYAPTGGAVLAVNKELEDAPEKINQDPYGVWMVRMEAGNFDASKYMDAGAYEAHCAAGG